MTADKMTGKLGNPGSLNRYAYAGDDPINAYDPSGLYAQCPPGTYTDPSGFCCEAAPTIPTGIISGWAPNPYAYQQEFDCIWYGEGCPSFWPIQTQGGTAKTITITNLSTTNARAVAVQNDLRWLQQAIDADPACSKWLSGSDTAISFMLGVAGTGSLGMMVGVGTFSDNTVNAVEGTSGTNLSPGSMLITVNTNGAFFSAQASVGYGVPAGITGGSGAAQALILLHELAHALEAAGFIANDGPMANGQPNVAAQTANNQLVMQNCGNIVNLAGH